MIRRLPANFFWIKRENAGNQPLSIEKPCEEHGDEGGNAHADEARHHETMVEEILSDDGRPAAVEVDGGDVRRIVGNEEITIDAGEDTEEDFAGNA